MTAKGQLSFLEKAVHVLKAGLQWTPLSKGKKGGKALAGEEYLCLNVQEQEIKLTVVTSKLTGDKQVDQFFSLNTQGLSDEDIIGRLKSFISNLHLKHPHLIGVVSSNLVVSRNIEIPSRNPAEIREILSLQASRHTPYARDEIIIDYINLGVFKSVYTKVLFIIVPRMVIMRYYNIAFQLGIEIEKMVFLPEAIGRFFWKQLNFSNDRFPVCIVLLESVMSEFLIMFRGAVLFVRSIPVGAKHFEVAREGYLARFVEEIKKSLDAYQNENIDLMPSQIVLGGATQGLEDLNIAIQDSFNMSVKHVSDLDTLSIRHELREQSTIQNLALLPGALPAMLVDDLVVDLTSEESKLRKVLAERSKQVIKAGILTMILLGLVCLLFGSHIYFKTVRLQELSTRYEPIRKEAKALEESYSRVRAIKTHLKSRGVALETLVELASFITPDLYLNDVKFESGKKINVKGSATVKSAIFALVDSMGKSKLFKNVQTKNIASRTENGVELSDFEIAASVS